MSGFGDFSNVGSFGGSALANPVAFDSAFSPGFGNLSAGDYNFSGSDLAPGTFGGGGASNGMFGSGMNGFQLAGAGLDGLKTIAGIWGGLKMLNLAKKQFTFNRDFSTANLGNSIKSYNTALADRARGRAVMESQTPDQMNAYVNKNSLSMPKSLGGGS